MTIHEGRANRGLIWTVAFIGLLIIYAPPIYLLAASFNPSLQPGLPDLTAVSLKWYAALSGEKALLSALWQSLLVALVTALIATIMALATALAYFELGKRKTLWFLTAIMPMFIPGVIQA